MFATCALLAYLWHKAVNIANNITNILPTRANLGLTPHELLIGTKSNISHWRIFGCLCYVHDNSKPKKLDPRSTFGAFMCYDFHTKGFHIYLLHLHKVISM